VHFHWATCNLRTLLIHSIYFRLSHICALGHSEYSYVNLMNVYYKRRIQCSLHLSVYIKLGASSVIFTGFEMIKKLFSKSGASS
jgi:hypothetical protein